jgi:protein involved in plasmid replication-relaxation
MLAPKADFQAIHLQDRDFRLLCGLFESRVMTAGHVAALYFDGKREAAKKRLQRMKAAGLIGERKRRVNEPSVLFLTRQSFALLNEQGLLSGFPKLSPALFEKRANVSDLTLRHELEVMDVKAAFHSALKKSEAFNIAEFSTWPRLHEFKATRPGHDRAEVLVKPDGFIRIHERENGDGLSEHTFFLEVDRSTETQDTLVNRAGCYLDYYKSGGFAERNGASRSAYKEFPFRVLMVLKNAERRNNTADGLLQSSPPVLTLVHLSTFAEVMADPVGAVWIRPIDYREAVKDSPFEGRARTSTYRRQTERQALVEQRISKLAILEKN